VTYRSGTVHRWQEQDTGGAFHVGARVRFQPKSHFHIDGVTLIRLDVVGKMVVGSKRDDARSLFQALPFFTLVCD
jgi:hypothetical protein